MAEEGGRPQGDGLTDRVWVQQDTDLPGAMQVFLSDGTLISDSCWETHRLSAWKQVDATHLSWEEDGMPISAEIVSLTADELVLKSPAGEQRFKPADVPYVCPDMPKE
ncbi:hypothetical protein XM25_10840 [Devosia sp. H5989]|nr:hypothetical protein XM25_10840 [Devosia sp. H5989]